ncbi:uncharacterized protein B0T15DRAFT_410673 [Chaetomium strumarium]|uniref:Uncharacterized protein n=1 Tax=Chaetomium strumarium TaxID=1170767 RepID=A0AAJ0GY57_9PEZI|nr:hypothetical protein B0T15DRAFT_410673 [Chaetomium strumarium]
MPSQWSKFGLFARLRERVKAANSKHAHQSDGTVGTAPATSLDQRPCPQQPEPDVAITTDTCTATAVRDFVDIDVPADDDSIDMSQRAQPGSSHASPAQLTPAASRLETLPSELRLQVLAYIRDLDDLRSLILASPVIYQQYRLDRKHVLSRVLLSTLGSMLVDAHAVQRSATLYSPPRPLAPDAMRDFLHSYISLRFAGPELALEDCTLADLLDIAVFHQSVARPLSLKCAALFLQHLDPSLEVGSLSDAEQTRLLRALYRFQLYCNLFGQGPKPRRYRAMPMLDPTETLALFFSNLNPWEVEEIDCIYTLIRNKYDAVFDASQCEAADRRLLREGTALRGIQLFSQVLATHNHEELVKTIQRYQVPCYTYEHVLSWATQHSRRALYASEGDLAEARREKLVFAGDTEDGPPLAWVIGWRGRYVNAYGPIIPAPLKTWGHVFWDRRRLIESKGKDEVLLTRDGQGQAT